MVRIDSLTCVPIIKCGVIYKDTLDLSAEWRYYGADDNQMFRSYSLWYANKSIIRDNHLMVARLICGSRSSYEMRKIRRYTEWQSMPYKEKISSMTNFRGLRHYLQ